MNYNLHDSGSARCSAVTLQVLGWEMNGRSNREWERERERKREAAYLLSHPGQSALASGSQAASQGGRSRSSWPQPGGRQRRTRPGSALRLCRSLTAPFKHTLDSGDSFFQNGSAAFQSDFNFHTSFQNVESALASSDVASCGQRASVCSRFTLSTLKS